MDQLRRPTGDDGFAGVELTTYQHMCNRLGIQVSFHGYVSQSLLDLCHDIGLQLQSNDNLSLGEFGSSEDIQQSAVEEEEHPLATLHKIIAALEQDTAEAQFTMQAHWLDLQGQYLERLGDDVELQLRISTACREQLP